MTLFETLSDLIDTSSSTEEDVFLSGNFSRGDMLRLQVMEAALVKAESFISGFEDDELQEGIPELLGELRACLGGGELPKVTASTAVMETSAGPDFFTMIRCEDRELSLYRFKHRYQSEFTVAELNWLIAGGQKPELLDYNEQSHPDEVAA